MKHIYKALKFSSIFAFVILSFIACDKDFNIIESDVLGKDNANFDTNNLNLQILAYNKKLDSLQINGLGANLLGVFNDPAYGQTTASIITQVTPATFDPDFGDNPVIDSVILKIPYFSRKITDTTYVMNEQDSLYGSSDIKLTIYQNNYFLRDFNPDPLVNDPQGYYSKADGAINTTDNFAITDDAIINFDDHKGAILKDTTYTPSNNPIKTKVGDGDTASTTISDPAFRIKLDNSFWTTTIIDKEGSTELSNANNFKDYFRGLYFKAEAIGTDGNMILLNLASTDANITIYYSKDSTVEGETTQSTYTLNFTGNRLNTFINNYNLVTLTNGDKTLGDEKLYLKGAEGSMAIVDLFSGMVDCNGTPETALECFKKTYRKLDENGNYLPKVNGSYPLKKLINEAHLVIYEDVDISNGGDADYHKYDRIYAYDIKNNTSIIDYDFDPSDNTDSPFNSRIIHLGQRITDDNGVSKYKIRITEHINNILLRDSTNTKLGLVLSNNVNVLSNSKILKSEDEVNEVPATAILTSRGTVLYGTNVSAPNEDKKMKLEIFFTDPNL